MKLELENNLTFIPSPENILAGGETSNVCAICHKGFLNAEDLRNHNENHFFSCSECNQAFNSQITLTKHSEEAHSDSHSVDKTFHCTQCDKSFKELRTLRLHLKIHNADYPEHCEVCKKGFRTKWQLKQHLMDHGGKRPYPCPECSFTCKTKQQLNEHRRKHSGEKAYSCPLCGTRFTYRNGLIKHTKLNRCPKKIFTSEGEKLMKKKSKSGEHIHRHKVERLKGFESKLELKSRAEKSELDQKILEVIQKRSALKSQVYSPEMSSLDCNNNQELLRRAAIVQELTQSNKLLNPIPQSPEAQASVSLPHSLISSNGTTATFLTNSSDISSWAATLPAGTKVTVTHYDASKKSGQGQLVATPTHTETIIVTPPKSEQNDPNVSLISLKSQKQLQLPTSPLPIINSERDKLLQESSLITAPESLGQPSYSESFAVDPNEILLKNKPIKQEPDSLSYYQESNFNIPPVSPIDVQLTAQALLMNVKPDPTFDPNLKIKKEYGDMVARSPENNNQENWCNISSMNDIKREVLDELFENHVAITANNPNEKSVVSQSPGILVPQLSITSENEDSLLENDDFYKISLKNEPISPQSSSSASDNDHDSFSCHRNLDTVVASTGRAKQDATLGLTPPGINNLNCKSDLTLPELDIDFSNFFDENITDINMNEQDFLQMRMDTFDGCSEIMSNV